MCGGICIFSSSKKSKDGNSNTELINQLIGILLVGLNLMLDGYTNNEQDSIFAKGATSMQVMRNVNLWQCLYLAAYLIGGLFLFNDSSELSESITAFTLSNELKKDIFWFCVCASTGQVLIFAVMKQYGSLVWITVSITRKLLTILFSVFIFNHDMNIYQWIGIFFAGCGMLLEVFVAYQTDQSKTKKIAYKVESSSWWCCLFDSSAGGSKEKED